VDILAAAVAFGIAGVQPNPASTWFDVALTRSTGPGTWLELVDLRGTVRLRRELGMEPESNPIVRFDVPVALASGIYWIRLRDPDHSTKRQIVWLRRQGAFA
jgi:hypothetical protein